MINELLDFIRKQRSKTSQGFVKRIEEVVSKEEDVLVNNHLLLFTSALVPKGLSSLLTSAAIEVGKPETLHLQRELRTNPQVKHSIYKEIQRLYPPFLGGRRLVRKDCIVDGYKVPAGHAVVFMTYPAQRDPQVYIEPDQFNYRRWMADTPVTEENLFAFGYGPRGCIGQQLVWNIIDTVMNELLTHYQWELLDGQNLTHKYLPVSRPKGSIMAFMRKRASCPSSIL
nr:hypothetical protein BaRGS_017597 [Batillaria attramentaria]